MEAADNWPGSNEFDDFEHAEPIGGYLPREPEVDDSVPDGRFSADSASKAVPEGPTISERAELAGLGEDEVGVYLKAETFAARVSKALKGDAALVLENYAFRRTTSGETDEPDEETTDSLSRIAFLEQYPRGASSETGAKPERQVIEARWCLPIERDDSDTIDDNQPPAARLNEGEVLVNFHGMPSDPSLLVTVQSSLDYYSRIDGGEIQDDVVMLRLNIEKRRTTPTDEFQGVPLLDSLGVVFQRSTFVPRQWPNTTREKRDPGKFLAESASGWLTGEDRKFTIRNDTATEERLATALQRGVSRHHILDPRDERDRSLIRGSAAHINELVDLWARVFPSRVLSRYRAEKRLEEERGDS